jgi:hypothetical protein
MYDLTHDQKVALFVYGMINDLAFRGLIDDHLGEYVITESGEREYQGLIDAGFSITMGEFQKVINCMLEKNDTKAVFSFMNN